MMLNKVAVCLIVFLCLQGQAGFAAVPVWVSFHETVKIAGPDILLGEIADVECEDAARAAELRLFKVGNAAAPGGKVVLSERVLHLRLIMAGGSYDDINWKIPPSVTVETRAISISGALLVQMTKDFIDKQLQAGSEQRTYALEPVGVPNDFFVPENKVTYEFKLPYGIKYGFPTNVNVLVSSDGKLYRKAMVRLQLHIYEPVVIANRVLSAKEVIGVGDVRLESMDVGGLGAIYFTDPAKVIGMVVKRTVNSGVVLSSAVLNKPIVIERMARIYIVSSFGGVQVQTEGEALQDGREGDWIRVKNLQSNKILSGKVLDHTKVEVLAH